MSERKVDFELVQDEKNPRYVDVVRGTRKIYMIDLLKDECTCYAGTFSNDCWHKQEWKRK